MAFCHLQLNEENEMMYTLTMPLGTDLAKAPLRHMTQSTLFDLIEAVHESVEAGEEELVTPIVVHLLRSSKATFLRDLKENTCLSPTS